jgi:hypothetical protein
VTTKKIEDMPWGVKGIDRATRQLVKQAADNAGMTIGAWVKKAVHEQASGDNRERGVELPPEPIVEQIRPRVIEPTSIEDEEVEDELSYLTAPAPPLTTNYHGGGTSKTYLGNPNLKAAGVKIDFTQEQYEEYVKCARDPVYFIEHYVKIVNVDRGLVPFKPYPYQANMVNTFKENRFVVSKLPRQTGKSTTVVSFMLWKILFHDQQSVAILANKGALARDMLAKLQLAYEHLPAWLQQGVITWNKGNIVLENGSKVIAAATSSSAVRGGTYNLIFLDEYAFVPRNIAEHFFSSVYPTISSGETTQIIVVSTPFGMNHFYKMWTDAVEKRSLYVPIEVHWRDTPGRDDKFREQTIKNTSLEQWRQEFECEFIGSTNTLINPTVLRTLAFVEPFRDNIGFEMYKKPESGRTYVMTVDTARGVEGDSSAVSVIDVTSVPYEQVAKYKNNQIPSALFPDIVARCGRIYNGAMALIETNDVGQQVADSLLLELEYENILSTVSKGRAGQKLGGGFAARSQLGLRMTAPVKRIGCANLKDLVETHKLIVRDFDTINELSTFVSSKNSYEAEEGCHDDLVMTLVMFGWLARQNFFKELTNTDFRKKLMEEQMNMFEEDLLPAGFVDDGRTEEPQAFDQRFDSGFYDSKF